MGTYLSLEIQQGTWERSTEIKRDQENWGLHARFRQTAQKGECFSISHYRLCSRRKRLISLVSVEEYFELHKTQYPHISQKTRFTRIKTFDSFNIKVQIIPVSLTRSIKYTVYTYKYICTYLTIYYTLYMYYIYMYYNILLYITLHI